MRGDDGGAAAGMVATHRRRDAGATNNSQRTAALAGGLAFLPTVGEDRVVESRTRMARKHGMAWVGTAVGLIVGLLVFGGLRPQAQEAGESEADQVSPTELQTYIDVYTAMQADHDLTLDTVLAQKNITLADFRNIERRVQKQDRLVRKVRDALQAQAKARAEAMVPPGARAEAPPQQPPPK
jgi:hypothetical protein